MRAWLIVVAAGVACAAVAACSPSTPERHLDPDLIRVSKDARMRTDTVGEGKFVETATFVLVDADNVGSDGALITLGGTLADSAGTAISTLLPESLWVPAGATRTFALVDGERVARPTAIGARVIVKGALIPTHPPVMRVEDLHSYDDYGKQVVAATVINDADRPAKAIVIAAFHDADGRPMTRPFSEIAIGANVRRNVQFVGPPGSTNSTIFVGDVQY